MTSSDRSIRRSFNNSKFEGNTNIQADDNIQIQNTLKEDYDKAFSELFYEISKIKDEIKREQAHLNAESLREAFESNNTKRGQRLLTLLKEVVGTVASLTTIARFFGL